MRTLLFTFLLTAFAACRDNAAPKQIAATDTSAKDTIIARENAIIDSVKTITLGNSDTYEKLPRLDFKPMKEAEFNALKPENGIRRYPESEKDSIIYIQTKDKNFSLRKYNSNNFKENDNGYKLSGVLPLQNLFVLTKMNLDEGFTFSSLMLLDSLTNYRYTINSFGDAGGNVPETSSGRKYLIYYYNLIFAEESKIGILKINDRSNPETYLSEFASGDLSGLQIETIVWESDSVFCVKGYRGEAPAKKFEYYRCELP
ncbi:MAG: hypothetical protein MUC87_18715 [Bacteroidia bacterium]|jgi:hypothetical protein|nr:hypothetical protein [Bacteroidia bacterium]